MARANDKMPTRRDFLSSATVTLLLIPLVDCGGNPRPAGGAAPFPDAGAEASVDAGAIVGDAAPAGMMDSGVPGCNGVGETSSSAADPEAGNAQHTHTLCVLASDLANPPLAGVTYTTSLTLSHVHTVTLNQEQLQTIASGGTQTVTTTNVSGHTHTFTIMVM
jgi:hypothetical protein